MDQTEAAKLLGVPEAEVTGVAEVDAGTEISVHVGVPYLFVPKDRPDHEGKTGLMYARKPAEGYNGVFPVFTPEPGDEPLASDTEAGTEPPPARPARKASTRKRAAKKAG